MNSSQEYLFDDYFDNMNLNDELKTFYQFINDEELNETFIVETELIDIRNENYKRYNNIDLFKIENLPKKFDFLVNEIKKFYEFIDPQSLLNNNINEAHENKKILDLIYEHMVKLDTLISRDLNLLEKNNNEYQEKIKTMNYEGVDKKILEKILNKFNDIVLYNSVLEDNIYDNYKRQLQRKKYINELYKMINVEINDPDDRISEIEKLNKKIALEVKFIYDKISYLEDLMMEKSKYENEFLVFKNYFVNLIAYDDTNYSDVYRTYNSLCNDLRVRLLVDYFEEYFIKEIEDIRKEEKFIYEKYGIKNIKSSLNYISANYMDFIDEQLKCEINQLYDELNSDNYDLEKLYSKLKKIVNVIWQATITDVYSYVDMDDFCFICTNNQFIDEKHECILITKKMLERVTDYSDYQIGFICNFSDNILYVTENEDIMSVKYNDMSNLKTPKQIEQEFLNFKVCNRIALNGYITHINAVYFINDGDFVKYKKAIELANQYKLPLIILKK